MEPIITTQPTPSVPSNRLVPGLQVVGVISTAIGALVLMVEGLGRVDAIARFFSFSGILALCAAIGLLCSYRRGDQRSARILLAMYLGLVPVFWSQLGAVVFTALGGDGSSVPAALRIEVVSMLTTITGAGIAALVIAPFSALVARVLIPSATVIYTSMLLGLGALLCCPDREGLIASILLVGSSSLVLLAERCIFTRSPHFDTLEAKWSRAVLLSIPLIMVGRAAFYGLSEAMIFSSLTTLGAILFLLVAPKSEKQRATVACATDLGVALGILVLAGSLHPFVAPWVTHFLMYTAPAAFLLLTTRTLESTQTKVSVLLLACGSILCRNEPSAVASTAAIVFPLGAIALGTVTRSLMVLLVGLLTEGIGSATLLSDIFEVVYDYRWSALMLAGIALVAGAPFAERITQGLRRTWNGPPRPQGFHGFSPDEVVERA